MKLLRFKRFENIDVSNQNPITDKIEETISLLPIQLEINKTDTSGKVKTFTELRNGTNYISFTINENQTISKDILQNFIIQSGIEGLYYNYYNTSNLRRLDMSKKSFSDITLYIPFELTLDELCEFFEIENDIDDYMISLEDAFDITYRNLTNIFEDDYNPYENSDYENYSINQLIEIDSDLKDFIEEFIEPIDPIDIDDEDYEFDIDNYEESKIDEIRDEINGMAEDYYHENIRKRVIGEMFEYLNDTSIIDVEYNMSIVDDEEIIDGFKIKTVYFDEYNMEHYDSLKDNIIENLHDSNFNSRYTNYSFDIDDNIYIIIYDYIISETKRIKENETI